MTKDNLQNISYPEQVKIYSKKIKQNIILKNFYQSNYNKIVDIVYKNFDRNENIQIVEIGCGPSFLKDIYQNTLYTDIESHDNCDLVVDATNMPFEDEGIDVFFLHNVFHHIPNIEKFFLEARRCLKKNGIIYIIDPHNSFFSKFIYKYFHHEIFDTKSNWKFISKNPQTDSNQALAWIVFTRDINQFNTKFVDLKLIQKKYFSFLTYIVSGGVNNNLKLPIFFLKLSNLFEKIFKLFMKKYLALFCEILIKKL